MKPYTLMDTEALRYGVRVSIVPDTEGPANDIEMSLREPHYFVRAEFHHNGSDLREFLRSVVEYQRGRFDLTVGEAAHIALEDPDEFSMLLADARSFTTERMVKAAEKLGARFDIINLEDPFDDWDGGEVRDE